MECDIEKDSRDWNGNFMYHINKKGKLKEWWEWQILITITKNYTFNIRLNPYWENLQKFYYFWEKLDTNDLMKEVSTFHSFLTNEEVPSKSRCKKEDPYNGEDMDVYLADYLSG